MSPPEPRPGEFDRIRRYLAPLAAGCPGALGLTDDAALLRVPADRELVVTTDAMVAGVHFLEDDPPADIAAKLLRTNLSDLAAMGAGPFGYSLVLSLPRETDETWLAAFAGGLAADQRRYGIPLIGGDSVSTRGPVTLAVSALGLVPVGTALTRRVAASPEDRALFVTGSIGDAALGLRFVLGDLDASAAPADDRAALIARLRRPEPRLAVGQALRGLADAAIDVSDGLVADIGHICEVSGCAAVIESARLPLSAPARALLRRRPDLIATVLAGGDYELAFAAPAARRSELAALAGSLGVAITEIGRLETGPPGRVMVLDTAGQAMALGTGGWNHFG